MFRRFGYLNLNWLASPAANATCGDAIVTNDFYDLSVNYPLSVARSFVNSIALFGPESYLRYGELELAHDLDNTYCGGQLVDFTPGKIAVIDRGGGISFVTKVRNAEFANAMAVIICNNVDGPPVLMGDDYSLPQVTIPVMMISLSDGLLLKSVMAEQTVGISMKRSYLETDCLGPESIPVTFTAIDNCGNHVSKVATFSKTTWFTIEKSIVGPDKLVEPGGAFHYNIGMANLSGKDLSVHMEDTEFPTPWDVNFLAGMGWSTAYNRSYSLPGIYTNFATATATDADGNTVTKSVSASVEVLPIFTFELLPDVASKPEPGGEFMILMRVVNNSDRPMDISGVDVVGNPFSFINIGPGTTLLSNNIVNYTDSGFYILTAIAEGIDPDGHKYNKTAQTKVEVTDVLPDFSFELLSDPAEMCEPGGDFSFTMKVQNNGIENLDILVEGPYDYDLTVYQLSPGFFASLFFIVPFEGPGAFRLTGNATASDNEGNSITKEASVDFTVNPLPVVLEATLRASSEECYEEPCTWEVPVEGSLTAGYSMCLDPAVDFYYFDLLGLTTNTPVAEGLSFPFMLDVSTVPDGFYEYWAAKGVVAGAPGMAGWMYGIITGVNPMFHVYKYLNDLRLIDGYRYKELDYLATPALRISGDYPPGTYTFKGSIWSEGGCKSEDFDVVITFKQQPIIHSQPVSQVACIGEPITFSVDASGTGLTYQWYKNGEPIAGATASNLTLDPVSIADAGDYTLMAIGECSEVLSDVAKLGVKEVIVNPAARQYSDPVTITAIIHNGAWLYGYYDKANLVIGGYVVGAIPVMASGDDLIAVWENFPLLEPYQGAGFLSPGMKAVKVEFMDPDRLVLGCVPEAQLEILPENARLAYDGVEFQATGSATTSTATVTLIAVLKDWEDGWPGDVREACITFRILDDADNLVQQKTLQVNRLVMPGDISTGIVTFDFLADLGAADYKTYTVKIIADCYYVARRVVMVTVYKPAGDFITGGGHLNTLDSYGTRAGEPDTHTNFGFHVKFNKKGTNLTGGMNIIYRRMVGDELQEFKIKTNALNTLGVNIANPEAKTGVFTAKANLTNLTTGNSVEGNLQLYVTLTDRGEPGDDDGIGFTLWKENKKGQPSTLIYSSSWNGVKTRERNLEGGNLVVHSGFSLKVGDPVDPVISDPDLANALTDLQVYPNPTTGPVTLKFMVEQSATATIDIYSSTGQIVQRVWDGYVKAGEYKIVEVENFLAKGLYLVKLRTGSQTRMVRLVINSTY